ncbi:serine hydrolase [Paenibacillus flagellatus]|uniref:Serine hydrolase n=1 Tax=Paenibacillus flagellatus TaxID=2211139 RepID=A0A2V5L1L4_9BACL|nr:serine hydrolase [Paenibacillus flagellatus]
MDNVMAELMSRQSIRRWANRPMHRLTVGLIRRPERTVWTNGTSGEGCGAAEPVYEIGSITKTMTGLLLASGERDGLWSRSDRLSALVPEWQGNPFAAGTTLLDLATHTSGLPAVPGNMKAAVTDRLNPYANYGENRLVEAVLSEKAAGNRKHRYSNYGFGLLGWLLARRLGKSLDEALAERVFVPLGMTHTGTGASPRTSGTLLLPVFHAQGKPVPHWDFHDATGGAGAVRSTMADMMRYADAMLNYSEHALGPAIEQCLREHYAIMPGRGIGIGFAWMRYKEKDGTVTHWHNGGTYGSSSFVAFNREKQSGFVVLSNYGSSAWSQIAPMIGLPTMSVDRLASLLSKKLFQEAAR